MLFQLHVHVCLDLVRLVDICLRIFFEILKVIIKIIKNRCVPIKVQKEIKAKDLKVQIHKKYKI